MRFYLKETASKFYLFADIRYKGIKFRVSAGFSVNNESAFNITKQRFTPKFGLNYASVNNKLAIIESKVNAYIADLKISQHEISQNEFKEAINLIFKQKIKKNNNDSSLLFIDNLLLYANLSLSGEILHNHKPLSKGRYQKFITTISHLKDYESANKVKLNVSDINDTFGNSFYKFLNLNKNLVDNSAGGHLQCVKTFLNFISDNTHIAFKHLKNKIDSSYKKIKIRKDENPPTIALTSDEIKLIEQAVISPALERSRDLMILEIYTCLRVSDLFRLTLSNLDISANIIKLTAYKTKKETILPLTNKALSIFKKYNYELPKLSSQKYNSNIKKIAKAAGITSLVKQTRLIDHKEQVIEQPKYKLLSSHALRRTGVTLLAEKSMPLNLLMEITGHSDLATLQKYLRAEKMLAISHARDIFERMDE